MVWALDSSMSCRDDADGAYLNMVAASALKAKPASLLLLTGGMRLVAKPSSSSKPRSKEGCFLLAGSPGTHCGSSERCMY